MEIYAIWRQRSHQSKIEAYYANPFIKQGMTAQLEKELLSARQSKLGICHDPIVVNEYENYQAVSCHTNDPHAFVKGTCIILYGSPEKIRTENFLFLARNLLTLKRDLDEVASKPDYYASGLRFQAEDLKFPDETEASPSREAHHTSFFSPTELINKALKYANSCLPVCFGSSDPEKIIKRHFG